MSDRPLLDRMARMAIACLAMGAAVDALARGGGSRQGNAAA